MTHSQKIADFNIANCQNPSLIVIGGDVHSNAFYDGGLNVDNFVYSDQSFFMEYHRQRRDFAPEIIAKVQKEWLLMMTNPENFGKKIGLTKCTEDKAKYLSQFI